MKVSFVYNAQLHQVFHSLPIALELAAHHHDIEVHVAAADPRALAFARRLAERYGLAAPVRFIGLRRPWVARIAARLTGALAPAKKITLGANLAYFRGLDALVVPERTSLALRRLGLPGPTRLIYTGHGAGDRAMAVAPEIREFDFVLNPGPKLEARRRALGLIRPGAYATGIYAKFDWLFRQGAAARPLFANDRPTVLYSPHFDPALSSWPAVGRQVLDWFAANPRFNLVFAPHVRLFEPARASKLRAFRDYASLPHMLVDLGSERSIDMTYTAGTDAYLGDVSSQVAEFLVRPRPCVFLNPRRTHWRGDPNYRFWQLGPVLEDLAHLGEALDDAFASHPEYVPAQEAYFEESFGGAGRAPSARRGADEIAKFLRHGAEAP